MINEIARDFQGKNLTIYGIDSNHIGDSTKLKLKLANINTDAITVQSIPELMIENPNKLDRVTLHQINLAKIQNCSEISTITSYDCNHLELSGLPLVEKVSLNETKSANISDCAILKNISIEQASNLKLRNLPLLNEIDFNPKLNDIGDIEDSCTIVVENSPNFHHFVTPTFTKSMAEHLVKMPSLKKISHMNYAMYGQKHQNGAVKELAKSKSLDELSIYLDYTEETLNFNHELKELNNIRKLTINNFRFQDSWDVIPFELPKSLIQLDLLVEPNYVPGGVLTSNLLEDANTVENFGENPIPPFDGRGKNRSSR